jgi:hypothetical protein
MEEIRYRVLIRDPRVENFVAGGADGTEISGRATAAEILARLERDLGESFDQEATKAWLEVQEPADAGASATLPLTGRLELEIVVTDTTA